MASTISAGTTSGTAIAISGDTSGSLQLQTNGTTTAVTIDTSQNVGIGTSSPSAKLDVTATSAPNIVVSSVSATGEGSFGFKANGVQNGLVYYNHQYNLMTFSTNATERMRIDSSGNVRIGTTAGIGSEKLTVTNSASAEAAFVVNSNATPYGMTTYYSGATPNNTSSPFYNATDGTKRFEVRSNGGVANYSANNVNLSDIREKTNIKLAGSYLDKICAIPVKTFNYIDQNIKEDGGLTLGVIAQDVQAIAPELISELNLGTIEEPKERLSIYQTDLQYALMKCIQEQQALIIQLQADVAALKGVK